MDQHRDPTETSRSAELDARVDDMRRRLDAIAAKNTKRDPVEARLAQIESTVELLSSAVDRLTTTVIRLAHQRLGEPAESPLSPALPDPDDSTDNATGAP